MTEWLLALAASYLLGSIPTAYLLVRWAAGVDVRTVSSGNVGATNAARAAGARVGLAVFVLDLLKGLLATWLIAPWALQPLPPAGPLACGVAAVVGHAFPVFLRLRGGKGVATAVGTLLGAALSSAAVFGLVWLACFLIWRYVSVASMVAAGSIPLTFVVRGEALHTMLLAAALGLLIIVRHRTNLQRLLRGCEPSVKFFCPKS